MAKTGMIEHSDYWSPGFKFSWQILEQDGMSSTIQWKVYMTSPTKGSGYFWWASAKVDVLINNGSEFSQFKFFPPSYGDGEPLHKTSDFRHDTLIYTGTSVIVRDSDTNLGEFNVTVGVGGRLYRTDTSSEYEYKETVTYYYPDPGIDRHTIRGSWQVETTTQFGAGAQVASVAPFTDEENPVITYTYDKGALVDSMKLEAGISFNGSQMDIPYREVDATSNPFTLELLDDERPLFWSLFDNGNSSAPVRFYLRTTETVGPETGNPVETYALANVTFCNHEPVFDAKIYDTNEATIALTGNPNHLIRYMSTAAFEINASPRKGGLEIISQYIKNDEEWIENIPAGTFTYPDSPTSNTFYLSATDNRGFTGTGMYSLSDFYGEFIRYVKLTCKSKNKPITPDGEVEVTLTGKYFNANFGAKQNQISLQYIATPEGEESGSFSEPVVFTPTMTDNTTYSHTFIIEGLDYTKKYNITVRVIDLLMTQDSSFIAFSIPVFDWSKDDFAFYVPVTINGAEVPSIVQQGTSYPWTYRLWSDGVAECWTKVNFSTAATRTLGSFYTSGNLSATNIQYPFEFTENPVVIVSLGADNTYGAVMIAPGGSGSLSTFQQASTTQTGMYMIIASNETNSTSYTLNYYVKGRWK